MFEKEKKYVKICDSFKIGFFFAWKKKGLDRGNKE